jgi:hypothetical protein
LQKKLTTFHCHISGLELRLKRLEAVLRPDADQQIIIGELRAEIDEQEGIYRRWESMMTGAVQWDYVRWAGRIDEKGMGMLEGYIGGLEKEMVDWEVHGLGILLLGWRIVGLDISKIKRRRYSDQASRCAS